jgi:predicted metal-binding membrane protein
VPRRDRIAILLSLAGVTALAWVYLFRTAGGMTDTDPMNMVQMHAWGLTDFLLVLLMWAIMMVGMMVPTAAPMTMVYAAVARKATKEGSTVAPTATFVAGYIATWTLFSVVATVAQWGLDRAALLSPMMVTTSPKVGAALLIAAGVYQLTPAKTACLRHCRSPAHFISEQWRPGITGAFRMGSEHGAFCLGCCWLLMALLFVGGVMNLLWVAAIAVFVLFEKVIPHAPVAGRIAGGAMILTGLALLATWTPAGG